MFLLEAEDNCVSPNSIDLLLQLGWLFNVTFALRVMDESCKMKKRESRTARGGSRENLNTQGEGTDLWIFTLMRFSGVEDEDTSEAWGRDFDETKAGSKLRLRKIRKFTRG